MEDRGFSQLDPTAVSEVVSPPPLHLLTGWTLHTTLRVIQNPDLTTRPFKLFPRHNLLSKQPDLLPLK